MLSSMPKSSIWHSKHLTARRSVAWIAHGLTHGLSSACKAQIHATRALNTITTSSIFLLHRNYHHSL